MDILLRPRELELGLVNEQQAESKAVELGVGGLPDLDHPKICTIHEINETAAGQLYLVMAYYEGETLKDRIDRGPLALNVAVAVATQVGQGLAEAHGAGIVH